MALEQMLACLLRIRHVIALYRHYQRSQMGVVIAARFRYDSHLTEGRRKEREEKDLTLNCVEMLGLQASHSSSIVQI